MLLGILSDTHDDITRTRRAIAILKDAGAEALIHCGDLSSPPIVAALAALESYFVFGNHDADHVPRLQQAAREFGVTCLGWHGIVKLAGKRIGVVHGHMRSDLRRVLAASPDVVLSGHTHLPADAIVDSVRRINPGALFRADRFTVALLNIETGDLAALDVLDEAPLMEPPKML
jgi:putative phosphoesterase